MEQKYEEDIQKLQQEIEMLEAEQEETLRSIFVQHGDRLQQGVKSACEERGGGGAQQHAVSKLITEVRELEKDLRRQTEINGITLNECFVKTLHKSERKLVQQLRLAGHCGLLLFQVEFAVTEIQEKYPDVVNLPEGCRSEIMIIRSPQLPGISMTLFWKIHVSKEGVVKPLLDLLLKMPDQALELDTKKVMEKGSDYFQSLLQLLGVEASIEGLIRAVCS
ncbi:centromere protein P isoform X1 [Danio rerio]|uniref:Centromere protein P isoform X1 n=1 Tax=Danio rerio TaxID=7955 RepID=A0AC58IE76_DANRE